MATYTLLFMTFITIVIVFTIVICYCTIVIVVKFDYRPALLGSYSDFSELCRNQAHGTNTNCAKRKNGELQSH